MTPPIDINEVLATVAEVERIRAEKLRAPAASERPVEAIPLRETPPSPTANPAPSSVSTSTPLHTEDVAAFLGCSTRTVKERARLGQIPHRKVPACRRLVFFEAELREWLDGAALEARHLNGDGRTVRPVTAERAAA